MARALRVEFPGAVYHVIVRGNERRAIFRDTRDHEIYLERLAQCRARYHFCVLAYCLMPNHVHLALQRGPGTLSRSMLALSSFYAQKFNFRHGRVGHLFQGRYKAFLVQDERYLFALLRYIHLNPVEARLVDRPEAYRWSSDRFYRRGNGLPWLDVGVALGKLATTRKEAVSIYRRLMACRENQTYEDVPTYEVAIKGERRFAERALALVAKLGSCPAPGLPNAWPSLSRKLQVYPLMPWRGRPRRSRNLARGSSRPISDGRRDSRSLGWQNASDARSPLSTAG